MHYVFVSYMHEDGDFAEVLINRIEKAGFKTWIDSDKLHVGEDWRIEIDQAIRNSFALVVVMTPQARASDYVTYEWAFAWGAGVKVIPLIYKDVKLHPRLEALQHLDFTSHNRASRPWDALIKAIEDAQNLCNPHATSSIESVPAFLKQPIEALDSADADERYGAIQTLAKIDHPVAYQAIKKSLQHTLSDVRIQAAFKLAEAQDISALPVLLKVLQRNDLKYRAIDALQQLGSTIIPNLKQYLHEKDVGIRRSAVIGLRLVGDATATLELLEAVEDEDKIIRLNAIRALGNIGAISAIPSIVTALDDNERDIRSNAALALGKIGGAKAIPGLLKALYDREGEVRESAVEALGQTSDVNTIPNLLEALHDDLHFGVRKKAIEVLGKISAVSAVPNLLEAFNDFEDTIQDLEAVKQRKNGYGSEDQKRFLFRGLQDSIIETLIQIGNPAVPYIIEALQEKSWQRRQMLIGALGKMRNPAACPALCSIMRSPTNPLRYEAAKALSRIGDPNTLLDLLQSEEEDIKMRRITSTFLIQLGADAPIPNILKAIHDEDEEVYHNAIKALEMVRDSNAVPNLIDALAHPHKEVRRSASKALVEIGDAAVPDLLKVLSDEQENKRTKNIICSILTSIGTPFDPLQADSNLL